MEVIMKKRPRHFSVSTVAVCLLLLSVFPLCAPIPGVAQSAKAYVSSQDGTKLFVFDLGKNSLSKTIDIFTPSPLGKVLPPNINDLVILGEKLFMTVPGPEISAAGLNEIRVLDIRSDAVVAVLKTGMTPSGLLAYQGSLYVVNRYGHTIQQIDPTALTIVRTIPFAGPGTAAVNNPLFMEIADGKIYLAYPGGLGRPGGIQVLDMKNGEVLKFIDFGPISPYGPMAIKMVGDGKLYLGGGQSVAVLDTKTDRIIKTIPLSGRDVYVQAFVVSGSNVYVANGVSTVSVIDGRNDSLVKEIDIGYYSYACHLKAGMATALGKVFVADAGRGLKIIDPATNRLALTIAVGEPLGPMAITAPR
jgi:DNA-binding beta-propeller fold protein YncE